MRCYVVVWECSLGSDILRGTFVESILLIRYSALGDVVLATSVVATLREQYPQARIDWVVDEAFAELLQGVPDGLITFQRRSRDSRQRVEQHVRGKYSLAIDLQNKWWSNRIAQAAAPQRFRLVLRTPFEAFLSLLGRGKVFDSTSATQLYAKAARVDRAGRPVLYISEARKAIAEELLPGERWVAVAPGASRATKRWPAERFAQVAVALQAQGYRIALAGGPMDGALLDAIRQGCPLDADLSDQSLATVAAGLARVALLIGNDSGLMHIASALNRPALALFGPTSINRWGPSPPGRSLSLSLACSPCSNHGGDVCPQLHHRCLLELSVTRVFEESLALLS